MKFFSNIRIQLWSNHLSIPRALTIAGLKFVQRSLFITHLISLCRIRWMNLGHLHLKEDNESLRKQFLSQIIRIVFRSQEAHSKAQKTPNRLKPFFRQNILFQPPLWSRICCWSIGTILSKPITMNFQWIKIPISLGRPSS